MTSQAWWLGMPSVEAGVDCGGSRHKLVWERGSLVPVNHADPEGERLLLALGGEAQGCLEIIAIWDDQVRNPRRLLATAPRSDADKTFLTNADLAEVGKHLANIAAGHPARWPGLAAERLAGAAAGKPKPVTFRSFGIVAGVMASGEAGWRRGIGLLELYTWPRPFVDRLQLHAWAARSEELRDAAAAFAKGPVSGAESERYLRDRPVLLAAAIARVRAAVISWATPRAGDGELGVKVQLSPDDAPLHVRPSQEGGGGAAIVTVGVDWIAGVFGRQMGVVSGHLVSEVLELTETTARISAYLPLAAGGALEVVELARSPDRDAWVLVGRPAQRSR